MTKKEQIYRANQVLKSIKREHFLMKQIGGAARCVAKIGISFNRAVENLIGCRGHRKRKIRFRR